MPRNSSKHWNLFFFCCSNILISFNTTALTAGIPEISRSLKIPTTDVANVIGYYLILYGLGALLYVPLTSRVSIKSLMIISTSLFAFGNWMCLWAPSLNLILWGRIIAGFAAAAVTPLALITLGRIFEKEVRGRVIGLFFSASFFGATLGLLLNICVPWHWQFIVPTVFGFLLSLGYLFCPIQGMEANTGLVVNYLDAFRIGGLRRILILIFGMSFLFHGVCKWYGVYLDKIYLYDQKTISFVLILTAMLGVLGQNVGGFLTDKLGRRASCYIGIIILSIAIMLLSGHYSLFVLILVLSAISLGWTIAHNGISTVLTDFSASYRAELAALNSCVRFFSGGVGFWLSGNFVQNNFGLSFLGIGILMLLQAAFIHKIIPNGKEI